MWPGLRGPLGVEDRTASGAGYALTFDDGPHPQGTPAVLEILARERASATFFLVGEQVRRNPALAREIVAAGHRIGLHCDRHRNLLRLAPRQVRADIARAQDTIEQASGRAIALYRPPYGVLNASALQDRARARVADPAVEPLGQGLAGAGHGGVDRRRSLTGGAGEGSVLLLHDADDYSAAGSWRRTAAALPRVLETLAGRGLQAVAP